MATLGWRDSGSVVLSKNEALRQEHDEGKTRETKFTTMSRRKGPKEHRRDEKEERDREEAAEFNMDIHTIVQKRPESRMKWLNKAMLLVGKRTIKAGTFYECIMDRKFVSGIPDSIGAQMKASILGNLHLFSPKQQKSLQAPECHFNQFLTKKELKEKGREMREDRDRDRGREKGRDRDRERERESGRDRRREEREERREDADERERGGKSSRKRRARSSDDEGDRSRSRSRPRASDRAARRSGRGAEKGGSSGAEEEDDAEGQERRDPRMFAMGAADDEL
eukprot:gb/GFBE01078918.1/.p1 GENE.gb/GFBE01078918.1/~~gb/GFBE01078918.1/.p1  ORF type:complete len:281 (+),score=55.83 gb/GFBE01078918.1/:1-843(+)